MGIDGKLNRIAHYFKDVQQTTAKAKIAIGLNLSKSQAFTVGLKAEPQSYEIVGVDYADCLAKADAFVKANFPGCTI